LVCVVLLNQHRIAFELMEKLVLKGCLLSTFEQAFFNNLRQQNQDWQNFLAKYPQLHQQYTQQLNYSLINLYDSLDKVVVESGITINNVNSWQDVLSDENIMKRAMLLKSKLLNHAAPNEAKVGYLPKGEIALRELLTVDIDILLFPLKVALLRGELSPTTYLSIVGYYKRKEPLYKEAHIVKMAEYVGWTKITEEKYRLTDENLIELGLHTFQESLKKAKFGAKFSSRYFLGIGATINGELDTPHHINQQAFFRSHFEKNFVNGYFTTDEIRNLSTPKAEIYMFRP